MKRLHTALLSAVGGALIAGTASAETLTLGTRTETTSINPNFYNSSPNTQIADHIFNPLVIFDHQQRMHPGLALSWKAIDNKTWDIKLRRGVKFHDGSPFTADDVIDTFDEAQKLKGVAPTGNYLRNRTYKKIDDYTIQIGTGEPYPLMPNDLTPLYIVASEAVKTGSMGDFNSGKAAIGTGPYKFVEWVPADRLVLEANPDYWDGAEPWERVVFKPIVSEPSRLASLYSGDVDIINYVPTEDAAKLKTDPKFTTNAIPSNRVMYLSIDVNRDVSPHIFDNDGKPLFPNPLRKWEVRKAISLGINREAIVERVMNGFAAPAAQMATFGMFGFNSDLKADPYDPEQAKKLLAQVGYPDGFRVTVHGPQDRYVNDSKVTETIGQMLTKIGIKAEVVILPKAVYNGRASRGGEYKLPEFSMAFLGFGTSTGETSNQIRSVIRTQNPQLNFGHVNRGRYSNVRADARFDKALTILDDAEREKLIQEAAFIYFRDLALIPLHYQVNIWALKKGLTYQARTDERMHAMGVRRAK